MPGYKTTSFATGGYDWLLNTHALRDAATGFLDISTFTKATHYPNDLVPSGLIVNCSDLKALKPFTGAVGERFGIVAGDFATNGVEDFAVAVLLGQGTPIKTSKLPVVANLPATAPAGWVFVPGVDG